MRLHLYLVFTITYISFITSMPNQLPQHLVRDQHTENSISLKRQQKGPYSLPITHQYLVPTNLHVIPLQKPHMYQNSHQNRSATQLVPIYSYIPLHHNYLVPVQDLQVIPLSRHRQSQQIHYRVESRNDEVNRFRTFRGGYGTGLYFGGHGAGHGFYVYG
ncbi:hypothetical protein O0L34_g13682 [Tuta absoluta]|nr:hypothetical protein O0L34_g13682 [Tuta absoluta]